MDGPLSQLSGTQPGGHELRREVVVHHQRERILGAAVELIAEQGYRAVSVAAIVKRAATGRIKFYENFSSKEDCFLVAFDAALEEATRRVGEACASAGDLPARVEAGVGALLDFVAARPDLARACVVEAPTLGAAIEGRRERALAGFSALVGDADGVAGASPLPADLEASVLGGLYWLLYDALLDGRPQRLEPLRRELVEFALLSFPGASAPVDVRPR